MSAVSRKVQTIRKIVMWNRFLYLKEVTVYDFYFYIFFLLLCNFQVVLKINSNLKFFYVHFIIKKLTHRLHKIRHPNADLLEGNITREYVWNFLTFLISEINKNDEKPKTSRGKFFQTYRFPSGVVPYQRTSTDLKMNPSYKVDFITVSSAIFFGGRQFGRYFPVVLFSLNQIGVFSTFLLD